MIEEVATVIAVGDDYADVATTRQSACDSCGAKSGCGTSLLSTWFPNRKLTFRVRNTVGARMGDMVVLGLDESRLQSASLILYGVPLMGLLIGAVGGERLADMLVWDSELGAVVGGLFGLIAALMIVRRATHRRIRSGGEEVRLLRIAGRAQTFPSPQVVTVSEFEGIRKGE